MRVTGAIWLAALGLCAGASPTAPQTSDRETQQAWTQRRFLQWGGDGAPPTAATPPPAPTPTPPALVDGEAEAEPAPAACVIGANGNVYRLHGLWMVSSWSTVSAAGVFIARYCRRYPWWITWHIRLQVAGAMGTVGFVAVAVAMVHEQLATPHARIGAIFGIIMLLQVSAGEFVHTWSVRGLKK